MNTTLLAFVASVLGAFAIGSLAAAVGGPATRGALLRGWVVVRRSRGGPAGRAVSLLAATARRLAPAARAAAPRELEGKLAAAGLTGPSAGSLRRLDASDLMGAKLVGAALAFPAGMLAATAAPGRLGFAVLAVVPVAGFMAPDLWLARLARERARRIRRELPGMLDLLRVSVEAGLSLSAALTAVGERTGGTLGAEWRMVAREVALGVPLAHALRDMAARVPLPEISALIGALDRAIRHGAPLADTLAAQSRDARESRRRRIREEAARAGPKIQLVVALLLVPSVLLLVAAALLAALVDGRGGVLPI